MFKKTLKLYTFCLCGNNTAARYLNQLAEDGVVLKHKQGKTNYYININLMDAWCWGNNMFFTSHQTRNKKSLSEQLLLEFSIDFLLI